jgi:hypothetical protein
MAADPAALTLAARSTAPDGMRTCAGIVFGRQTANRGKLVFSRRG